MSTPKNKLSSDFDRRGKRTSVVQRFITAEPRTEEKEQDSATLETSEISELSKPLEIPEISEVSKVSDIAEVSNVSKIPEALEISKIAEASNSPAVSVADIATENPSNAINVGGNAVTEVKEVNQINETEELKNKIEFLTLQLDKIKELENKLNNIEDTQSKLKTESEKKEQPAITNDQQPFIEPQPKYYLRNVMEEAVVFEVTSSLKHISNICKCEKCFYDICAIVLNSTNPNYATSEQGELLGKANTLLNVEIRNKISGEVFKAVEKVKKQPMHNNPVYDNSMSKNPAQSKSIGKIVSK